MSLSPTTPSQTVGPYLSIGLTWADGAYSVTANAPGAIWIGGRLIDGQGAPVPDGLIETWQADPEGGFGSDERAGFRGFGRSATDADGVWRICTLKPGRVPTDDGTQAPHVDVSVFARGLLHRLVTRIYFADEEAANAGDPVLRNVPADRVDTLIAQPTGEGYHHDIVLQGDGETVFFTL